MDELDRPIMPASATPPSPVSHDTAAIRGADARHAARSGMAQVLTVFAQALLATTQVLFVRLFSPLVFGSYQAALAIVEVATRGGAAGADKAMLRYVPAARAASDPEGVRRAIGTGLRLCLTVAGSLSVLLLLIAEPLARAFGYERLAPAVRILSPLPILTGCLYILIQASLAARVTRANFYVRGLLEPMALLVAGVGVWALGGGLLGLVAAHVVATAITLAASVVVVTRVLRPDERHGLLSAPRVPGFVRFAVPMGAAELVNTVLQRADLLILTGFNGPEAAATYVAAEYICRVIANVRYAFDSIVAGVMSETIQLGQRDRLHYNLSLSIRWVLTATAPLTVTVIAVRTELLSVLYGSRYTAGAGALLILAVSHFANASLGLLGWVLLAAGRSRLVLLNNILGAGFNVISAFILIPRFGLVGAALSGLGATLVLHAGVIIEVATLERIHPFGFPLLKPVVAAAIAFAAQIAVLGLFDARITRLAVAIVVGAVAYGLALVGLGLPSEERAMAARLLKVLRVRG